ncbi:MAG TPA: hypothetical protein VFO55_07075 [Gemmatimonadaceae bacterium]|nr:hypothetical protein [Gemmatimonadaceae bacterium]
MNCADARHLILTADPSTIRSRTDAAFRGHVAQCPACAAAAGHVVADVDRLRAALIARGSRAVPARRPRRRVVATMIPLALAAELALFAFLSNRESVNPLLDRAVIDDSVTTLLPVGAAKIDSGARDPIGYAPPPVVSMPAVVTGDTATEADSLGEDGPSATPVAPRQLQVIPASRQHHVAVIATSNPKITVVWITKGDSL